MLEMRKLHSRGSRLAQVCQLISIAWFMVCFLSWFPIFKTHSHPFSSQTYTEPLLYPWVYSGPIQSTSVYWAPIVSLGLLWSYSVYKCLLSPYCIGEGKGNQLQYSCLEKPMDGGAWWATVHRLTKSRTQMSDFTFTFYCIPVSTLVLFSLQVFTEHLLYTRVYSGAVQSTNVSWAPVVYLGLLWSLANRFPIWYWIFLCSWESHICCFWFPRSVIT